MLGTSIPSSVFACPSKRKWDRFGSLVGVISSMPVMLDPVEFYRVRVRFLTTEEGGRSAPIRWTFANYRPDLTTGGGNFHSAVFMDAPNTIAPGDQADVEITFWCCNSHHQFSPGDIFYLHEGPRRIAEGTILEKAVKQYARPEKVEQPSTYEPNK